MLALMVPLPSLFPSLYCWFLTFGAFGVLILEIYSGAWCLWCLTQLTIFSDYERNNIERIP